jgi:hypothetical protein
MPKVNIHSKAKIRLIMTFCCQSFPNQLANDLGQMWPFILCQEQVALAPPFQYCHFKSTNGARQFQG